MAAGRSNTPASNIRPPHPKPTFTIEEWEAKAPLGDAETKSVTSIKAANERRPVLQLSTIRVCKPYAFSTCSPSITSTFYSLKRIMFPYHARQLPNNGSNSVQARDLPPQSRVPHLLHTHTPFTQSSQSRPRSNSTTGLR